MRKINTFNKNVATEPFPSNSIETEIRGGMARVKQKGALQSLKVMYSSSDEKFNTAHTVWVRAEQFNAHWAKEVMEIEPGKKFILVPESEIVIITGAF